MILELLFVIFFLIMFFIFMPVQFMNLKPKTIWGMSKLPGPTNIPFIGEAINLLKLQDTDILNFYDKFRIEYPRLVSYWILGSPSVVLYEPDDIEVILGSTQQIQKGNNYSALTNWLQEGLLLSTGGKWHQRRKLLSPAFHFKILENSLVSLNKQARYLVRNMLKTNGEPFVAEDLIIKCTLDIICETSMGYSLNLQSDENSNNNYLKAVKRVCKLAVDRLPKVIFNKEWVYKLSPEGKIYYKNLNYLHGFTEKIIKERKLNYSAETDKQNLEVDQSEEFNENLSIKKKKAFLDILIDLDKNSGSLFTDKDIREEVDTFLFEGHDTTGAALVHTLYLLGNHPHIQEKAYQEQFSIFGNDDRGATNKDLHEMIYLEMIIKESLRLYPSVPIIARTLIQDLKLSGNVIIPAGVNLEIFPFLLHRDERYYPNPQVFDPERFSFENCKNRHPYAYIPFSAGPRNCIGQKFAMIELKVILSTVIRLSKAHSVNLIDESKLVPLIILRAKEPIQIKVTPRI